MSIHGVSPREQRPLYIFITILLLVVLGIAIQAEELYTQPLRLTLVCILLVAHIALHWLVVFFTHRKSGWTLGYIIVQGGLSAGLTWYGQDFGLVLAISSALLGEALGVLGATRHGLLAVIWYLASVMGSLWLTSGIEAVRHFIEAGAMTLIFVSIVVVLYRRQITMREHTQSLAAELADANWRLQAYASEVEELTLAAERQRMARELHDTLAQGLAGLVLQLEAAKNHMENNRFDRAFDITTRAMSRARSTLAESRAAIDDLRTSPSPQIDLMETVQRIVDRFRQSTGIACDLVISLPAGTGHLDKQVVEQVERVLSEALFNISQHAQASQVWVTINLSNKQLDIEIRDNGIGFEPGETMPTGHYGLLGMRERIHQINGKLEITSKAGEGTRVMAMIPVNGKGTGEYE